MEWPLRLTVQPLQNDLKVKYVPLSREGCRDSRPPQRMRPGICVQNDWKVTFGGLKGIKTKASNLVAGLFNC